jgi:hypothetical protein
MGLHARPEELDGDRTAVKTKRPGTHMWNVYAPDRSIFAGHMLRAKLYIEKGLDVFDKLLNV